MTTAWLLDSTVRFTVLAAAVAGLLALVRSTSAVTQLRVWRFALVAALLMPLLPTLWVVPLPAAGEDSALLFVSTSAATTVVVSGGGVFGMSLEHAARLAYVIGMLFLLARLCVGYGWTRRLMASAVVVPGHTFMESALVHVPVTMGLVHPVIVLPTTWRSWPDDTRDAVIAHEQAHATRRDGLWATLAHIHRAIHWFNPFSWWLVRHLDALAERASDDAALVRGITPTRYAEILLDFTTIVSAGQERAAWIVPMARHSARDTERRLDRVLSWKGRPEMKRLHVVMLATALVVASAAVYTATVSSLSALPPDEAPMDLFRLQQFRPDGDGADSKHPIVLTRVAPEYTAAGRQQRIEGVVEMEVTISALGDVTSATVTKSLDAASGLDAAAVAAVKRWYFVPRMKADKGVASTAVVQMEFRLPDSPVESAAPPQQPEPVVTAPVAIKRVEPKYTPEAMRAKIQGKVKIEAVVNTKGEVTNTKILESLDAEFGLDANALTAASQWRYEPARYNGKVVPATVVIEMEFRLH